MHCLGDNHSGHFPPQCSVRTAGTYIHTYIHFKKLELDTYIHTYDTKKQTYIHGYSYISSVRTCNRYWFTYIYIHTSIHTILYYIYMCICVCVLTCHSLNAAQHGSVYHNGSLERFFALLCCPYIHFHGFIK